MERNSTRAPEGATTFTNKDDAAIIAAWDHRAAAFASLQALPDNPRGDGETPERHAQWAIIDVAEAEICTSVATTPRGAEIQLWCAAVYQFDAAEDEGPCYLGDLDYFTAQGDRLDWKDKLLIAAIRSLRAMQAPKVDTTAWDAALAEYEPIRKRWAEDFDEGEALPTREERDAAYKGFQKRLPEYRAAREKFLAVPAPTIGALAIKMGLIDPVDDDHSELCRLDAERLAGGAA